MKCSCAIDAYLGKIRTGQCKTCSADHCKFGYIQNNCKRRIHVSKVVNRLFNGKVPMIACTCDDCQSQNKKIINYFSTYSMILYTHIEFTDKDFKKLRRAQDINTFLNYFHKLRLAALQFGKNNQQKYLKAMNEFLSKNQTFLKDFSVSCEISTLNDLVSVPLF
jgi:hypothetical protein